MWRTLTISIILFSWTTKAQDLRLINKKTNSYIIVSDDNSRTSVRQISKNTSIIETRFKIPAARKKNLIDSLLSVGWTNWEGKKTVTKDFQIVIVLDSTHKVPSLSDSTYKFYYHFDISDNKNNKYSAYSYDWTTQIDNVKKAIKDQKISIEEIELINGTTIHEFTFVSIIIFNSDRTPGTYADPVIRSTYF